MAIRVKQGGTVVGQWDAGATVGSESLPDGCSRSRWRSKAGCRRAAPAQFSVQLHETPIWPGHWRAKTNFEPDTRADRTRKLQVSAQASGLVPVGHDGAILAGAAAESWLSGLAVCLASKPETSRRRR
jgi:hypothetical protein